MTKKLTTKLPWDKWTAAIEVVNDPDAKPHEISVSSYKNSPYSKDYDRKPKNPLATQQALWCAGIKYEPKS